MPIRETTIKEYSKRAIPLEGSQTLTEAIQIFNDLKYSEGNTYLVVTLPGEKYNVIVFSGLTKTLEMLGPDGLSQRLSNLPIPPASRIVPTDTTEGGGDIIDWLASHPQAPVVITDAGQFRALFVNPNRGDSGLVDGLSLSELHGEMVDLSQDSLADYKPKIAPPKCPHCNKANFYKLNDAMQFFCPACNAIL